jgi:ankyrin repeat protein
MRFFTKNRSAKKRIVEEWVYEQVADELDNGDIRRGLWTKARGLAEGDANKCEGIYIQLRAESIVDEANLLQESIETQKTNIQVKPKEISKTYMTKELQSLLDDNFDIDFKYISLDDFKSILLIFEPDLRKQLINAEDSLGSCLLHYTVKSGRRDCTEFLISQGANTAIKNYWGSTPLDIAEHFHMHDIKELLARR